MEVSTRKSPTNSVFSIAVFDYRRVTGASRKVREATRNPGPMQLAGSHHRQQVHHQPASAASSPCTWDFSGGNQWKPTKHSSMRRSQSAKKEIILQDIAEPTMTCAYHYMVFTLHAYTDIYYIYVCIYICVCVIISIYNYIQTDVSVLWHQKYGTWACLIYGLMINIRFIGNTYPHFKVA